MSDDAWPLQAVAVRQNEVQSLATTRPLCQEGYRTCDVLQAEHLESALLPGEQYRQTGQLMSPQRCRHSLWKR